MSEKTKENIKDEELIEEKETAEKEETAENKASEEKKEDLTVEEKLEQTEQNLKEQKDKYLRLYADFDNYKKRMARERLDLLNTAGKDTMLSILPTLDDFDRAIAAAENAKDVASVKDGMELIRNKLFSSLEQKGLKQMDCVGEPFDSEKQEALTEIPAPSEDMKGKVVDQIEKGYTLNDKIIRFAKVVVGK